MRARKANLVNLLTRDLVDLFGHHLEVYRQARNRIGRDVLDALSASEQDERLRQAMSHLGGLHAGLSSPPAEYGVLRRLMGGVVTSALRPDEAHCRLLRVLAREILASAVMRPLMSLFTPALINNLILSSLSDAKKPVKEEEVSASEERAKSEPSSQRMSGVHEEGKGADHGGVQKPVAASEPSFGAEDLAKFEKRKTALAAEHWDQMWVGAKGKRQRALAAERERRAREAAGAAAAGASEIVRNGERVNAKVRGSKSGGMSPLGSSTTSLNTFEGEEASPPWKGSLGPDSVSSLLQESQGQATEPLVPGIGWETDDWEDSSQDPSTHGQSVISEEPAAAREATVGGEALSSTSQAAEVKVVGGTDATGKRLPTSDSGFRARGQVGLAKLDANWMGLDNAPKATSTRQERPASAPRSPPLSTRSEGVVSGANGPPLSTRSENGDHAWEHGRGSSSWNGAAEGSPQRRHRRSLSGGLEGLASEEPWGDVAADVSKAHRRGSFEEPPRGALRRTSSEQLWEVAGESAPASPSASGLIPEGGWNRVLARVVGARMEESGGKAFAVYTIAMADSDRTSWLVQRRWVCRSSRDLQTDCGAFEAFAGQRKIAESPATDASAKESIMSVDVLPECSATCLYEVVSLRMTSSFYSVWQGINQCIHVSYQSIQRGVASSLLPGPESTSFFNLWTLWNLVRRR